MDPAYGIFYGGKGVFPVVVVGAVGFMLSSKAVIMQLLQEMGEHFI